MSDDRTIRVLLIWATAVIFCTALWPYTINAWLVYFGKSASITWWQGSLLGLSVSSTWNAIAAALATYILMFTL